MYNSSSAFSSSNSQYKNRLFVYEVEGLSQNGNNSGLQAPLRNSGSVSITVPYNRMNQEMRRINSLGGKVISIKPVGNDTSAQVSQPAPQQPAASNNKKPMSQAKPKKSEAESSS